MYALKLQDMSTLGKPVPTIIDEFLEKFQTAFDPPPQAFFGKNVAIFCYEIFWNGNDPPKLASQMLKILQRNFLDQKRTPTPPLWKFSKNSSASAETGFPYFLFAPTCFC